MTANIRPRNIIGIIALALVATTGVAAAQNVGPNETFGPNGQIAQPLELTPQQKDAIIKAVGHDETKAAKFQFPSTVGAQVPPAINLYALPDEVMNNNAAAKLYQFTVVHGDVVIVDPTKMQVVEVIRKLSN